MATCNLVACQLAIANRSRGDDLLNEKPRRTLLARLRHDLRRRGSVPNTTRFSGIAHPPTVRVCAGPPTPKAPDAPAPSATAQSTANRSGPSEGR